MGGAEVGSVGAEVGTGGAEVGTGGGLTAVVCSRVVVGTQVTGVAIMVGGAAVLGPGRGVGGCVAAVAIVPPAVGPVGTRVSGDLLRSGCVWWKRVYKFNALLKFVASIGGCLWNRVCRLFSLSFCCSASAWFN